MLREKKYFGAPAFGVGVLSAKFWIYHWLLCAFRLFSDLWKCIMGKSDVDVVHHNLKHSCVSCRVRTLPCQNYVPTSPWRNINWFWQLRFFKEFWLQWMSMKYQFFVPKTPCTIPPSSEKISRKYIYIEKFTNIGRSELRWDISGLFLDDRDISGFLSHWYIIIKSAQSCGR